MGSDGFINCVEEISNCAVDISLIGGTVTAISICIVNISLIGGTITAVSICTVNISLIGGNVTAVSICIVNISLIGGTVTAVSICTVDISLIGGTVNAVSNSARFTGTTAIDFDGILTNKLAILDAKFSCAGIGALKTAIGFLRLAHN